MTKFTSYYTLTCYGFIALSLGTSSLCLANAISEPIQACVILPQAKLTAAQRSMIANCLGWQADPAIPLCHGLYTPLIMPEPLAANAIKIQANSVAFSPNEQSELQGRVRIQQNERIVSAQTATIYRDPATHQVTQIRLLGNVHYVEPGRLMIAPTAVINPTDKSGHVEQALYRFDTRHAGAILPAWGRASWIERLANKNYILRHVTYTTCKPQDKAWEIEANQITLDHASATGIARNARLKVGNFPLIYTPYLSFPTSNARKSGLLMPTAGYSNVGGFDVATPYYLNLAPNYDATFIPHLYTRRGVMAGGEFRLLTEQSLATFGGNFLPNDRAFSQFIHNNRDQYPSLNDLSTNRWSVMLHDASQLAPNLLFNVNYQQVSDDYYLQDFSSNLAILTENQILRQGDLTYTTDHWLFSGMLQSYQTLHPINQSIVADVYERLPQLLAQGNYYDLPFHGTFNLLGQFDNFRWTGREIQLPQGPRYHLEPTLAFPQVTSWGYLTPEIDLIENNYQLSAGRSFYNAVFQPAESFNRLIPRYSADSGLIFERNLHIFNERFTQTLEPRLYYLYVPYQNQSVFPAFDSAYMIFNTDQLFRNNRFSGFDRIGDANQLSYGLTSRWLTDETGREKASVTVGQIRYFADRRVQLCYRPDGNCTDTPLFLGFLSPTAKWSPVASKAAYELSSVWAASGDYVWDPATHAANNGDLNLHYQPGPNQIVSVGYSYLVNGNVLALPTDNPDIQTNPLHQATFAYAWPFSEHWSSLGIYSYNLSEGYGMTSVLGVQYDDCCWAARLLGGRTFKSLLPTSLTPQYNNNIYFQVLLKGLGSVANSDPATTIKTYLPGYANLFQR